VQQLKAVVRAENGELLSSTLVGEARSHDEPPAAVSSAAVDSAPPSAVVVLPTNDGAVENIEVSFTPQTFPSYVRYIPFDSGAFSLEFASRSRLSGTALIEPPSDERLLQLVVAPFAGVQAEAVWLADGTNCTSGSSGIVCTREDGWRLGKRIEVAISVQSVAWGDVPGGYALAGYSVAPCAGEDGCTDYRVWLRTSDVEQTQIAVLRFPGLDDLADRAIYITGLYGSDYGVAPSCLETEQASMTVRERLFRGEEWVQSEGGYSYGYHDPWRNQVCANYSALSTSEGYVLMTGGEVLAPTATLRGEVRPL
jgi:hypothetical protein